jgi:hypothetical protein
LNQSAEVAAWLDNYDNPMRDVVRRVREIILRADPRIEEGLEGNAPAFSYRGTLASIFPESKKHASLMVARGAEIPGHHPRLEGSNDPARVMKIQDMSDANAARDDLQHLVRAWCDWRDEEATESEAQQPRPAAKASAKKSAAKKPAAKKKKAPAPKKKATKTQPAAKKARAQKGKEGKSRPTTKKSATKKSGAPKKSAKPAPKTAQRRGAPRSRGR